MIKSNAEFFIDELNGPMCKKTFDKLPLNEQVELLGLANRLIFKLKARTKKTNVVPPIGIVQMLELFAKLGIFLNKKLENKKENS
jgi:hypothetical protein